MPKKYKRSVSAGTAPRVETMDAPTADKGPFARRAGEFNPDYSYVIKDLKRIGVLAGSFFAILVVLSFFLNR